MGGCGVVVHTGARKHLSEPEALTIMEYMVRTALPHATEMCPLLLETPCNEGTEVCGKIEELGNFFFRFTSEERKKLGVCIDTCHVFSAGYDPLLYLQHWEKYCQTPIKLVHFNDSDRECGSCVDRHASPGQGHIGMDKMMAIAKWCSDRNIPMVRE
jgi:deoxyribonuclease-4